jgi:hypothetical protein
LGGAFGAASGLPLVYVWLALGALLLMRSAA